MTAVSPIVIPELRTSKGTIKLRPQDAAAIADDELFGLVSAALEA